MNNTLTKNIINSVKSLDTRKGRKKENAFKTEGTKCVMDTLDSFELRGLFATREWLSDHKEALSRHKPIDADLIFECKRSEIIAMSSLSTPSDVIAVYSSEKYDLTGVDAGTQLLIALDTIQDPGNLGTIIRVADWFGIRDILCSVETADCFSPKTIQSTMGSISRVRLHYGDLREMISIVNPRNIYGTFLDGDNITECRLENNGVIVIGNEGNGISPEIAALVTDRLFIPSYPPGEERGESLNAAIATAITLAKFRGI